MSIQQDKEKVNALIEIIEETFPPDKTEIGRLILLNALFNRWREMPFHVLQDMAYQCKIIGRLEDKIKK